ncbi:hypothetical protein POM88_023116 [Heracleum sosnowskyi]|uniref:Protein FAR1-RELATED SEQUENCE n=1 Tax=Heracleum sosnowskyi TaxID=360622 RepID=A0AAD8MU82_9APIA|nr:hypothetical protein POM88_023116 [Heracleum sosnowskyi]
MNEDLDEPTTPQFVYNDEFVDNFGKNEEFVNIDEEFVNIDEEFVNIDEDEEFVDVKEDDDNLNGENEDDDIGDDVYENVDGNGVPYMNQLFHTLEDACNFFRAYALKNGFAIKIQSNQRRTKSNEIYARLYVCRLSGKIDVGESSNPTKRRREILPKSDCKVRMYVNYRKKVSLWEITTLELNHNHGVVTPSKMNLLQREKRVNTATKSLIKTLYGSGIRNCQVMNVIGNIHGGNDKFGFGSQHVRNVIRVERKKRFEHSDVHGALDLLYRFNEESRSNFFIRTQVDEEQRLKCLVWVDPRCLMTYENFGDVFAFDTTYRTNRYAMPFVLFTGVNHHYQSVIFGFALMRDELATTFQWILST